MIFPNDPIALDLPGPSRRIRVEPITIPTPTRRPAETLPAAPEPAAPETPPAPAQPQPQRKPDREPAPA